MGALVGSVEASVGETGALVGSVEAVDYGSGHMTALVGSVVAEGDTIISISIARDPFHNLFHEAECEVWSLSLG